MRPSREEANLPTLALRESETSTILLSYDWERHALGKIEDWPSELRFAVQFCLNSKFPICMVWGEQNFQIYNDGYIPILGSKHPSHFGRPASETWPEIWEFLGPELDRIRKTGEPAWFEDFLLPLVKSSAPEECYFTFSYSPLHGTTRRVEGILSIAYDSTAAHIARRRTRILSDLVTAISSVSSVSDLWPSVKEVLRAAPMEFGEAEILMVDGQGRPARIQDDLNIHEAIPFNEIALHLRLDFDGRSAVDYTPRIVPLEAAGAAYVIPIRGRYNNLPAAIYVKPDSLCARDDDYIRLLLQISSTIEESLHRLQTRAAEIGSIRAALAEKESLYRSLLETTLDGVFFSYPDGTILDANRAAGEMLGYEPFEWRHMRRGDLFLVDDPALSEALRVRGETGRFIGEIRMRCKDGSIIDADLSSTILKDSSGASVAVTVFRDITQRKALQNRAEQSQKMEAIGQLTGGIAHDFNNLLTVILGAADDLELSENLDQKQRNKANMIRSAAETASALTSQLLAFSRKRPLVSRRIDVNRCVENTTRLLTRILGAEIELRVSLGAHPTYSFALVDPQQLELAIVNLALNSREAMPEGGTLTVSTRILRDEDLDGGSGERIAITVRDTGIGISKDVLPRIFEPFFTTKQRGQPGLGLGLSMVYGFATQSGGAVNVESEPGAGTAVTLLLPIEPEDRSEAVVPKEIGKYVDMVVLLVDDNDLVRKHTATQLLAMGFQVRTAESGSEAIEMLLNGDRIDILMSDIVMPGEIDGFALAKKAKQMRPYIRVLLSSGYQDVSFDKAVSDFPMLRKPYRISELRAAIDSLLV